MSQDKKRSGTLSNGNVTSTKLDLSGVDRSQMPIAKRSMSDDDKLFAEKHSQYQSAAVAYILDHSKTVAMLRALNESKVVPDSARKAMAEQVTAATKIRMDVLISEETTISRDAAGAPQQVSTALRSANVVMAAKLILGATTEAELLETIRITWVLLKDRLDFISRNFVQLRPVVEPLYKSAGEEMPPLSERSANKAERDLQAALAAEHVASVT